MGRPAHVRAMRSILHAFVRCGLLLTYTSAYSIDISRTLMSRASQKVFTAVIAGCQTDMAIGARESSEAEPITFLRNGTRLGYAIHTDIGAVPDMVAAGTPLPEVICALSSLKFPTMSSARKSCRRGSVLINGVEGRCISTVSPGDVISLQSRVAPGFTPRGKAPFDVDVIYEDDSLAVVFKPAGVVTHPPAGGALGGSMRTAIMHALKPPPMGTPGALYRPHCVHRLDKPTSGLMLCAKSKPTLLSLQRAFAERRIAKRYEAIVCGHVEGDEGEIDYDVDEKSAQTRWVVRARARSLQLGGSHLTLLSLHPKTGRTHQLRIHCAEVLGCPIVGDKEHGGNRADVNARGKGMFLAAVELTFQHPDQPEVAPPINVQCETPRKFAELLRREQERWEKLKDKPPGEWK